MEKRGWNEDEEGTLVFRWKGPIKAPVEFWSRRGVTALSPRQRYYVYFPQCSFPFLLSLTPLAF